MMFAGNPEITAHRLTAVETYLRTLAVPARRNADDPQVVRGAQVFETARCAVCHVPQLQTGEFPRHLCWPIRPSVPTPTCCCTTWREPGGPPSGLRAGGSEWRTPPLWGLGLSEKVNGHGAAARWPRA